MIAGRFQLFFYFLVSGRTDLENDIGVAHSHSFLTAVSRHSAAIWLADFPLLDAIFLSAASVSGEGRTIRPPLKDTVSFFSICSLRFARSWKMAKTSPISSVPCRTFLPEKYFDICETSSEDITNAPGSIKLVQIATIVASNRTPNLESRA